METTGPDREHQLDAVIPQILQFMSRLQRKHEIEFAGRFSSPDRLLYLEHHPMRLSELLNLGESSFGFGGLDSLECSQLNRSREPDQRFDRDKIAPHRSRNEAGNQGDRRKKPSKPVHGCLQIRES